MSTKKRRSLKGISSALAAMAAGVAGKATASSSQGDGEHLQAMEGVAEFHKLADGSVQVTLVNGDVLRIPSGQFDIDGRQLFVTQSYLGNAEVISQASTSGGFDLGLAGLVTGGAGAGLLSAGTSNQNESEGGFATAAAVASPAVVNHAPDFVIGEEMDARSGELDVGIVSAEDVDGDQIFWTIIGGDDQRFFSINNETGMLSFLTEPQIGSTGDDDGDGVFEVIVEISDGDAVNQQLIYVSIIEGNGAPVITGSLSYSQAENASAIFALNASDPEGDALTWSIVGGADAALFVIDSQTGQVSFATVPDFENATDDDNNNVYQLLVAVSDGNKTTTGAMTVTVENADEPPIITSSANLAMASNSTLAGTITASDPENGGLTFRIVGGVDAAFFTISSSGVLSFKNAPDAENPQDSGANNIYDLTVEVSDGTNVVQQNISVTVTGSDSGNSAPEITSGGSVSLDENTTAVLSVVASDSDGDSLSYAIAGGADGALFTINAAGELSFKAAPDFENPADSDGDNVYDVIVSVSDGVTTTQQSVTVTVNDVNDAPVLTGPSGLSLAENTKTVGTITASDDEGDDLTFSLTGGVDADLFTINATTGALSFKVAPDYEAPGDDDGDNAYQLEVTVSDGTTSTVQQITVSVTDANDAPVITSSNAVTITENRSNVMIASASDVDSGDTLVWSIAGGADKDLFTVDSATGALSFITAPDYEAPSSFDGGNVYAVVLQVSDGNGG
ncbi:hypothetical protein GRI39_13970, partial [Altererythrobacter indicus]